MLVLLTGRELNVQNCMSASVSTDSISGSMSCAFALADEERVGCVVSRLTSAFPRQLTSIVRLILATVSAEVANSAAIADC